jgi:quercetin dioxygenase-like cupin family protein
MEIKSITSSQIFTEDKFTKRIVYQKGESIVFVLNFMAGQALPKHRHPDTHVYILVLQGSGTVTVDGVDTTISELDVVHCDGNEEFSFINTGSKQTSLYVHLTKIPDARYAQEV